MADFASTIAAAYATGRPAIELSRGVHDGAVASDAVVQVRLAMMNRHGLVAGATRDRQDQTLQGLAEQLSAAGVPVCGREGRPLRHRATGRRPTALRRAHCWCEYRLLETMHFRAWARTSLVARRTLIDA